MKDPAPARARGRHRIPARVVAGVVLGGLLVALGAVANSQGVLAGVRSPYVFLLWPSAWWWQSRFA